MVANVLAHSLSRFWKVTAAGGGAEALGLIERERFDAMVCDLMMPGVSGMDLADLGVAKRCARARCSSRVAR